MPVRPKPAEWADETREAEMICPACEWSIADDFPDRPCSLCGESMIYVDQAAEGEAPALDDDDDPDALAGEEIEDPLDADDE